jgi:ACS family hexuronate transporter-like MFS transporter
VTQTGLPADGVEPSASAIEGANGAAPPVAARADAWAWAVCWLMFAGTVLNYMDRQAISIVGKPIREEFGLDAAGFGWVMAVFLLSYALFQVPAGYLADRWDLRKTYAGAVAWWSLAGLGAAFSPTLGGLLILRALLGVGESFNWPCALRVTARILPPADRSLGNGIFNSGAAVGAVVTPVTVTLLTKQFGWRTSFAVLGSLGFVWVAAWLALAGGAHKGRLVGAAKPKPDAPLDLPEPKAGLSPAARAGFGGVVAAALLVAASAVRFGLPALTWAVAVLMFGLLLAALALPEPALAGRAWAESLGQVVRRRRFWVMVVVSVSINVCWHFLVNWMPTYLQEDRGMTFLASGLWTAVPFLAADLGNLGGGALSRWLAHRGLDPVRARTAVMALCTLIISTGAWVGLAQSQTLVIVLLGLMAMGTAAFMANYFAFTQDVLPRHTGLIVGYLGGLGNLGAAGIVALAGIVKVRTGSFWPIFVLVGLVPFLGLGTLVAGWGRGEAEAGGVSEPA